MAQRTSFSGSLLLPYRDNLKAIRNSLLLEIQRVESQVNLIDVVHRLSGSSSILPVTDGLILQDRQSGQEQRSGVTYLQPEVEAQSNDQCYADHDRPVYVVEVLPTPFLNHATPCRIHPPTPTLRRSAMVTRIRGRRISYPRRRGDHCVGDC